MDFIKSNSVKKAAKRSSGSSKMSEFGSKYSTFF